MAATSASGGEQGTSAERQHLGTTLPPISERANVSPVLARMMYLAHD